MSKDRSGEAFDRLRAADPAAGLEPDREALRHAVAARSDVVDELAARRSRPARALQVAAAGAGALAIGVSGFALGGGFATSVVAGSESDGGAQPAITLGSEGAGEGAGFPGGDMATTEQAPSMRMGGGGVDERSAQAMSDAAYLPYFGRTVFSQSGLSGSGSSATAYGFAGAAAHSETRLRALADALGVTGEVREEYGALVIGNYENGEPVVSLYPDGMASFTFNDPTKDIWFCDPNGDECEERDLGEAPQGDDALDQAREVLVTLGQDPASFEFEVTDSAEYGSTDYSGVNAYRVVDGQRAGDMWGVSFSGAGVQSVQGSLAELVELGEYDVISPAEAVDRLNDARFGSSGSSYPPGWMGPAARMLDGSERSTPRTLESGDAFDWPVDSVTITSERLGLAQHHLGDGAVALVPSYELSSDDGRTWSVIAVADAHLNFG